MKYRIGLIGVVVLASIGGSISCFKASSGSTTTALAPTAETPANNTAKPSKHTFPRGFPDYVDKTSRALETGKISEAAEIFQCALEDKGPERQRIVEQLITLHALEYTSQEIYPLANGNDRTVIFANSMMAQTGSDDTNDDKGKVKASSRAKLIKLRIADNPEDPWIFVGKGFEKQMGKDWAGALEQYAIAEKGLRQEDVERFIRRRIDQCKEHLSSKGNHD